MTDVLVTVASRMGSTREIGEAIAEELRRAGLTVDVRGCAQNPDPWRYRAVVVGSALYLRRWLRPARDYLRHNQAALAQRRVWLFQSGPTTPDTPTGVPWTIRRLSARIGVRSEVVTFGGRLDGAHAVRRVDRWVATSSQLCGDARDWESIRRWARTIGEELTDTHETHRTAPRHGTRATRENQ